MKSALAAASRMGRNRLLKTLHRRNSQPVEPEFSSHIDRFVVFSGFLWLEGWLWDANRELSGLELLMPDGTRIPVSEFGLPSPDVAERVHADAGHVRFRGHWLLPAASFDAIDAELIATFNDSSEARLARLGSRNLGEEGNHRLHQKFWAMLSDRSVGSMLEIGSRARSGVVRRDLAPAGWSYTGMDVLPGGNVDVVGDAHALSRLFLPDSFDAVTAFSVLEHLLMPWKVVIELNRVMRIGGLGFFATHQCWPMHDQPWDFWRFSDESWKALFNRATGFEIIDTAMGEAAYVVANRCHAVTAFADQPAGFLASTVMFRKVAETTLAWDVELADVLDRPYPSTTTRARI